MTSTTVYRVNQGSDKKEPGATSHLSPDRRERAGVRSQTAAAPRASGGSNHGSAAERLPPPPYGQAVGVEWNKPSPPDVLRSHLGGASSKFQAMGLYDHKASPFQGSAIPHAKTRSPSPGSDHKLAAKHRTPSTQYLNKFTDIFLPPSKDGHAHRSPSPYGGPGLSRTEPESQQSPPPPPSPAAVMSRHDQKRMTLGHSKLDLMYHNKPKQAYSRFELKTPN